MTYACLSVPRYNEIMASGGKVWRETFGKVFTHELNRGVEKLSSTKREVKRRQESVFVTGIGLFNLRLPSKMGAQMIEFLSPYYEEFKCPKCLNMTAYPGMKPRPNELDLARREEC